jgi:hypothetical protein
MGKVRVIKGFFDAKIKKEDLEVRAFLKKIESESLRSLISRENSLKSEGKLAKENNFSEVNIKI